MPNDLVLDLDVEVEVVQVEGSIQFNNFIAIKEKVNEVLSSYKGLKLTDDNKQEIKKVKQDLNKVKNSLSDERIKIKREFVKPLELFELQVKEIDALIKDAVVSLDTQIKEQEDAEKETKRKNIERYFNELKALNSPKLDFLTFDDLELNITLSVTPNKLIDQVKDIVDKRLLDITEIETDANASRLLAKYHLSKNLQESRIQLNLELKREEEIKEAAVKKESEEPKQTVTPKVVNKPLELFMVAFKIKATKEQITSLKLFLEKEGIKYE